MDHSFSNAKDFFDQGVYLSFVGGRAKISTMAPGVVTRGGRLLPNLVPMFNKNEEKGYFFQSCVVRSAVIVSLG